MKRYPGFAFANDPISVRLKKNIAHHARHLRRMVSHGMTEVSATKRNWKKIPPAPEDEDEEEDEEEHPEYLHIDPDQVDRETKEEEKP